MIYELVFMFVLLYHLSFRSLGNHLIHAKLEDFLSVEIRSAVLFTMFFGNKILKYSIKFVIF